MSERVELRQPLPVMHTVNLMQYAFVASTIKYGYPLKLGVQPERQHVGRAAVGVVGGVLDVLVVGGQP